MKRILFLLIELFLVSIVSFAKPSEPEWFKNYRTVYPNSEYLAQRGSGTTAEDAKTDAIAQVSRYMKTSVNANLKTTITSISTDEKISEETSVVNDVELSSNLDLFGIETTESYYYKPEKKWYAVAYIVRKDAWIQYKPKIEAEKAKFYGFFNKAEGEEEPLFKCNYYRSAWKSAKELLEKLEFGRILNPKKEEEYSAVRISISEIPSLIESEMNRITVNLNVSGDYGLLIQNAVAEAFSENGFTNGSNGNYKVNVEVLPNKTGDEPLSITPSLKVTMSGISGKSLYSYQYTSSEKTVAYSLENAQKKAYPKIAQTIKGQISAEVNEKFSLK